MSIKPIVSIIIPNFNNEDWLAACLDSCFLQKGDFELEVIVVDDHSTDNSMSFLEDYKRNYPSQLFIYSNPKKGGNSARNYGFNKSNGDFIQWLDGDDIILKGKLKNQLIVFENEPQTDIVYSDWRIDKYKGSSLLYQTEVIRNFDSDFLGTLLENKDWNSTNSYLCRRKVCLKLDGIGGWSEETKVGQDREYFTQLAIFGSVFTYCKGVFAVYNRWSLNTVSNKHSPFELATESLRLNVKFYELVLDGKIPRKDKYLGILNAELLSLTFYENKLKVPRVFLPWKIKINVLHWKLRAITPYLYGNLLINYYLKNEN